MTGTRRLLVVDDEEVIRLAAQRYFGARGFVVDVAGDRGEAESLLSTHRYSAAIVDLRFGGSRDTDGLQILDRIKGRDPDTRALLLTGYCPAALEDQARSRGADAVLRKPQSLHSIAAAVNALL